MYSDGPVAHDCYLSLCIWWLVSVSSNSNWSVIATAMEQQHLLYAVFLAFVAVSPYCVRYATGTAVPFILFQNILFHITICYLTRFFYRSTHLQRGLASVCLLRYGLVSNLYSSHVGLCGQVLSVHQLNSCFCSWMYVLGCFFDLCSSVLQPNNNWLADWLIVLLWLTYVITANFVRGTVYIDPTTGAAEFEPGVMDQERGTAYGYYNNTMNETGWAVLEIQTRLDDSVDNKQLMYAAGFLEGVLTAR